jgi:cytochrome c-type biogenesis protein CcmF
MNYTGEHLLPGQIGHFFTIVSFVASLLATYAYFKSTQSVVLTDAFSWKRFARISFLVEVFSVLIVCLSLFYILSNHYFEYKYAFEHTSRELEPKYLFSAFWTNQQGSFLLWSFWHCILGLIIMRTAKNREAPVMTVVSFVQACLATMVLGIYFFGQKVGDSPFALLRDTGVFSPNNAPIMFDLNGVLKSDYLSFVKDGNDLNILLQNYWMVIHPPVLFLGFASVLIPFAFSLAGLWKKDFGDAAKAALPWALFSAAILSTGIMMGAAWAYESLNFGGYWAWDPVENASMVPWLVMIAGIHTLLIYKHTGRSLRTTHLFFILSFVLIVYSTFLTRSGILGDTSVHAFTDLGMNGQLYTFLYVFFWLPALFSLTGLKDKRLFWGALIAAIVLLRVSAYFPFLSFVSFIAAVVFLFIGLKQVPSIAKEEEISSREFWMFIGSLVFFLTALFIILSTSLPVFNKLSESLQFLNRFFPNDPFPIKFNVGEDVLYFYNRIIIFAAIIIGILTAVTQYLKYKETATSYFWKKIALPTAISAVIAGLVLYLGKINFDDKGIGFMGAVWIAVACSIYSAVANFSYIWIGVKGKLKHSGSSLAHFGFGLFLLGILLSSAKKEVVSLNRSGIPVNFGPNSKEDAGENLTLVKGLKTDMGKYWVTYINDSVYKEKKKWFYNLQFETKDGKEKFKLQPTAYLNRQGMQGLSAEPDAKHYWDHDIFTYISSMADPDKNKDTAQFVNWPVKVGDTVFYSGGFIIPEKIIKQTDLPKELFQPGDEVFTTELKVYSKNKTSYISQPKLAKTRGTLLPVADTVIAESLVLQINDIKDSTINLGVKESNTITEYLTLKAYKFPFIVLVWLGTLIMVMGIALSMIVRIQTNKLRKV